MYLLKRNENLSPHKNLCKNVCGCIIHESHRRKQSKWPLIGECIHKLWYIHLMKYYFATKRNEVFQHVMTDETQSFMYVI